MGGGTPTKHTPVMDCFDNTHKKEGMTSVYVVWLGPDVYHISGLNPSRGRTTTPAQQRGVLLSNLNSTHHYPCVVILSSSLVIFMLQTKVSQFHVHNRIFVHQHINHGQRNNAHDLTLENISKKEGL